MVKSGSMKFVLASWLLLLSSRGALGRVGVPKDITGIEYDTRMAGLAGLVGAVEQFSNSTNSTSSHSTGESHDAEAGNGTITILARIEYGFVAGTVARDPTPDELSGLIDQTEVFYKRVIQNSFKASTTHFHGVVTAYSLDTSESNGGRPVAVDFTADVSLVDVSASQFLARNESVEDSILDAMYTADYVHYIDNYVVYAAPRVLFENSTVAVFSGMIAEASTAWDTNVVPSTPAPTPTAASNVTFFSHLASEKKPLVYTFQMQMDIRSDPAPVTVPVESEIAENVRITRIYFQSILAVAYPTSFMGLSVQNPYNNFHSGMLYPIRVNLDFTLTLQSDDDTPSHDEVLTTLENFDESKYIKFSKNQDHSGLEYFSSFSFISDVRFSQRTSSTAFVKTVP